MDQTANTALQAAFAGNPFAIALVFIAAVVGTIAGIAFVVDKVWFHMRRKKNASEFEFASREDIDALHGATAEVLASIAKNRKTSHDTANSMAGMSLNHQRMAQAIEELSKAVRELDRSINKGLGEIRMQNTLTAARLDDVIQSLRHPH